MSLHNQTVGKSDEWFTPKYIFDALGCSFDLDVAAPPPEQREYISTPAVHFIHELSLLHIWEGFVWMNPPFGAVNGLVPWLNRFFDHGNGIALTPDTTSAKWWQGASQKADAVCHLKGRVKFIKPDGTRGDQPAFGTTLFAVGQRAVDAFSALPPSFGSVHYRRQNGTLDSIGEQS